jgi:phage terminase large subunit
VGIGRYRTARERAAAAASRPRLIYSPSPNILENVIYARDPELIVSGPAGTGKSRAILEKIFLALCKYLGCRALMFRKTRNSLNRTGIITWEQHVIPPGHGIRLHAQTQCYTLPNGSTLDVAGMDDPDKIKSGEWDIAFAQEMTECDEQDWDMVSSRLRNGAMPYQILIGDCNPSHPRHWAKVRTESLVRDELTGELRPKARMVVTSFKDNPKLWDPAAGMWTDYGVKYIERLKRLSGVTRQRLYEGLWVSAEGQVYPEWSEERHLSSRSELFGPSLKPDPDVWRRIFSVDFGFVNPFVFQAWAWNPESDIMALYRERYYSGCLVEDHARDIRAAMASDLDPFQFVADHDAEDCSTLVRHLGIGINPALKDVLAGIGEVSNRLKHGKLLICRDSLWHDPDMSLSSVKKPTRTSEEFASYTRDTRRGDDSLVFMTASSARRAEYPLKINDHGMDAMRYAVSEIDIRGCSLGVFI